jgi:DNA repair exonuclease SbcCD nuclease subunit
MNKLFLMSDIHLTAVQPEARIDNIFETQLRKLVHVLNCAKAYWRTTPRKYPVLLLQAGDFFDSPRSWNLLPLVIDLLSQYKGAVKVCGVFGQHDMYMRAENRSATNLGILSSAGLVHILGSNPMPYEGYDIYGVSWGDTIPEPEEKHDRCGEDIKPVLVIHAPILEGKLWSTQEHYDYARAFLKKYKKWYRLVLCGDIHRRFKTNMGSNYVVNTGSMIRDDATIYNFSEIAMPHFATFDGLDVEWVEIPAEEPTKVLTRDHLDRKESMDQLMSNIADKLAYEAEDVSFKSNLMSYLKKNDVSDDVSVLLSKVMEDV